MNMIDAKQVMAMAEYSADKARAKLDDAIDAEETRDELIAARAQEIEAFRLLEMKPIDVVCGMQSVLEGGAAKLIAQRLLMGDMATVGLYVRTLIHSYIKEDSEVMAHNWIERIEREANLFGDPQ
jgi:hypothetical protein